MSGQEHHDSVQLTPKRHPHSPVHSPERRRIPAKPCSWRAVEERRPPPATHWSGLRRKRFAARTHGTEFPMTVLILVCHTHVPPRFGASVEWLDGAAPPGLCGAAARKPG